MLKEKIEQDLKSAMLAKDKMRVEVLKGLKSAILYEEVATKSRETGLSDEAILKVLAREAKRRDDSVRLYEQAGESERAAAEKSEKEIIETYLPSQMSDEELEKVIDQVKSEISSDANMGQIIGAVKKNVGIKADGARIAAAVKAKM